MRSSAWALLLFAACANPPADRSEDAAAPAAQPADRAEQADPATAPVPTADPLPAPAAQPGDSAVAVPGGRMVPQPAPAGGEQDGWTAGNTSRASRAEGAPVLTGVRTARQPGFDRTVFEFRGNALPGYAIEYVDRPVRQCGSGDVVELPGDAWLKVRFNPSHAHTEAGRPTVEDRDQSPDLALLKRLRLICDYEGYVEWILALAGPNPYRVMELSAPTRLVVDVQHFRW